jgi:peroxin-6
LRFAYLPLIFNSYRPHPLQAPSESRRFEIIKSLLCDTEIAPDVSLRGFSLQTAAFTALDLETCVGHAKLYAFERAAEERCRRAAIESRDMCSILFRRNATEEDICFSGIALLQIDFDRALAKSREAFSQNVNAPKIPSVTWEDVGGLAGVKADILDTVQLPMDHPELFAEGVKKRSGMVLRYLTSTH